MGKRELVALLNLSSWCLVMVERLFLPVPWGCLWFVIVVFPDHTHLLFMTHNYTHFFYRFILLTNAGKRFHRDGLNSLDYNVTLMNNTQLFTLIMVDIGQPPSDLTNISSLVL